MNLSYFISQRFGKESKKSFSRTVSNIAILSIGIALAILIGAFLILGGFKNNIRDKVFSFDSHIQIYDISKKFDGGQIETSPISVDSGLAEKLKKVEGIKSLNVFSTKVGMIVKDGEVHAALMKGIGADYDSSDFVRYVEKGSFLKLSDNDTLTDVLVSRTMANKLKMDTGESFVISFLRFSPDSTSFVHKRRRFTVRGIFKTDLPEIDEKLIICDHNQIRWINRWAKDEVGGFEVIIDDPKDLEEVNAKIEHITSNAALNQMSNAALYNISIKEKYYELFDWLELLNTNVKVLIVVVFGIACINIFSILFILVMERTHTIGVLKAVGATDNQIFKIFWAKGTVLLLKGLVIGNVLALGFCGLQYHFNLIPLDPESYYMSSVPIDWNWPIILLLNLFVILFVNVVLIVPVMFISAVKPIKAIRFS